MINVSNVKIVLFGINILLNNDNLKQVIKSDIYFQIIAVSCV